jgi:hypothetical protein
LKIGWKRYTVKETLKSMLIDNYYKNIQKHTKLI